jgi:polyribonucleotide nucleotidyltransferase
VSRDDSPVQVGQVYLGRVTHIKAYGAFVELAPGVQGMIHVSELADHRVSQIEDVVDVGEEVYVKCIGVDRDGKIRLSRREALVEG